jgi:ribosomal protein L37AE/L43A
MTDDPNQYAEAVERLARRNGFDASQTQALKSLAAAVSVAVRARIPLRLLDQMVNVYACPKCEGRGVLGRNGGLGRCAHCGGVGWKPAQVIEVTTDAVTVKGRVVPEPVDRAARLALDMGPPKCGEPNPERPGLKCNLGPDHEGPHFAAVVLGGGAQSVAWPVNQDGNPPEPEPDQDVVRCGLCGHTILDVLKAQKVDGDAESYWVCGPGQCKPRGLPDEPGPNAWDGQ